MLTATTEGDYTHPILRGLWVLGTVMCKEPGQPPEGIPPLSDIDPALPIKQRLAQHRTDPSCAGCHDDIDPVGLGLENYDPIGRWRDHDGQHPVDAAGTLPGGFSFNGPTELAAYIAKSDDFRQCFAKHVAMFAVGRTVNGAESCQITAQLDDKSTIADVVIAIVTADAFGARTRE